MPLFTGSLEPLKTIGLETDDVRQTVGHAEPSGLAVGEESIYVTLRGKPYVLLVEKP